MRSTILIRLLSAGCLALSLLLLAASAHAAPNPEATLTCGETQYTVNGFGRGEPLHVVNSTSNYVITYARIDSDPAHPVIIDVPGQRNRPDIVTCTATSPLRGTQYTFQ